MPPEPTVSETETRPTDPLVGRTIAGRYRVVDLISRGAMGKVYRAKHEALGRTVAVKVLQILNAEDHNSTYEARFLKEASTLARLSHPHTVRVYDYGVWEGNTFLVMEFVEGLTLHNLLKRGLVSTAEALRYGMQVAAALHEAHEKGIVHRDLKPSNVLIQEDEHGVGHAKLVDFGLAKELEAQDLELTQSGTILGTPMYVSPEMIRQRAIDRRADIYALGVTLFRCLTGHTPWRKGPTAAVLGAALTQDPRPFSLVAPELRLPRCIEWTVLRCLEKEPNDRFRDMTELSRALKACLMAVEDPDSWDVELSLADGCTVMPEELAITDSFSATMLSAPNIEPLDDEPDVHAATWVVAALVLAAAGMFALGAWMIASSPDRVEAVRTAEAPVSTPAYPPFITEPAPEPIEEVAPVEPPPPRRPVRRVPTRPAPRAPVVSTPPAPEEPPADDATTTDEPELSATTPGDPAPEAPAEEQPVPTPSPAEEPFEVPATDLVDPWGNE